MSSAATRTPMAWAGWGDPGHPRHLPPGAERLLRVELALPDLRTPAVALADVRVPPSRLSAEVRRRLVELVGAAGVAEDREARIRHAGGRSYPDLLRLRNGDVRHAPDAVVRPASHEEVATVLAACAELGIAVVPFGGGTSVVGGVEPDRGRFASVVSLDLSNLSALMALDPIARTATLGPGLRGVEAEALLNARGHTLGHFPQSYEYATIGGFVATRSAGQASTGYGRIDDLVQRVRCATPSGELVAGRPPASAAGPDLLQLLVGSEGALGVLTEITLRIAPVPAVRRYEGWALRSYSEGLAALRTLAQEGPRPDVARLSDHDETRVSLAQVEGPEGVALRTLLRARRRLDGCLVIAGYEGSATDVDGRRKGVGKVLRAHDGMRLGRPVGDAWAKSRFSGPYLRDALMDRGVLVDTLETAATWDRLPQVYAAVRTALRGALTVGGRPPIVLCHVSHLYVTGASLYFTFLAPAPPGQELDRWRAAKDAAGDAITEAGATITHHHAVGRDHLPWMDREVGALGMAALRAVKDRLDPEGIMNPGKLLGP
jgi:alkyldihydroxyacetonephosphate synthase